MDSNDLAALLCSRICHDLLSPIGAMNNGLELLHGESDPALREGYVDLLQQSATSSANKLKFFRLAFGAGGGFGDTISTSEAKSAIEGLMGQKSKIELDWLVQANELPKGAMKVLMNLAALGVESLVRGGTLFVGAEYTGGDIEIVVRADGERVIVDSEVLDALQGRVASSKLSARNVTAFMTNKLVADRGGQILVAKESVGPMMLGALIPR